MLEPIWKIKTETATRIRGRIESILDWAKVRGFRNGNNPAAWKGHLDKLLPRPTKIAQTKHFAALDFRHLSQFMADLRCYDGMGPRALEFAILTAARSGEVRGATWEEIDFDAGIWIIPAHRMKAGREHRVPLSDAAMALLSALPRFANCPYIFPGNKGKPISDMTLTAVLRRMKQQVTVHGFRSTFRDWIAENTSFPNHVAEMALAHAIDNKVEQAYRRGDLFSKRKEMMQAWAAFCSSRCLLAA